MLSSDIQLPSDAEAPNLTGETVSDLFFVQTNVFPSTRAMSWGSVRAK